MMLRLLLPFAVLLGCNTAGQDQDTPRDAPQVAPEAQATTETLDVVRVDPETFIETRLGRVEFDEATPFTARVVTGKDGLEQIVQDANALPSVTSSGGTVIPRTSHEFLRLMKAVWFNGTKGLVLREPLQTNAPPKRHRIVAMNEGSEVELGIVELDDRHYLRVTGGPADQRARLGKLCQSYNSGRHFSVPIPPPEGETHGKWGRLVARGSAEYFKMLNDALAEQGYRLAEVAASP